MKLSRCNNANLRILIPVLMTFVVFLSACGSGSGVTETTAPDALDTQPASTEQGDSQTQSVQVWSDATYATDVALDVSYGQGLSHSGWNDEDAEPMDLLLDIYQPVGLEGKKPAIVFIHGGGFTGGDKSQGAITSILEYLVQRGFVGISINYRLAGDFGSIPQKWGQSADDLYLQGEADEQQVEQFKGIYPAVRDAKAALRWVFANAESLQIDTDFITVAGGSAGAAITMATGNTELHDYRDELDLNTDDPSLATTNLDAEFRVHTLVNYWGGTVAMEAHAMVFEQEPQWDPQDIPACVIHGTEDTTVPYSEALTIQSHYEENGVNVELFTLEGAGHGAWGASYDGMDMAELAFYCITSNQPLEIME